MTRDPELGPLEMLVLGLLDPKAPSSVADVRARLDHGGHKAAYTTVMTVLSRLADKGLALRKREGNRFLYVPAKSAARAKERILARVRTALFRRDKLLPLAALVEDELSDDELRELRALIDARLGKERGA